MIHLHETNLKSTTWNWYETWNRNCIETELKRKRSRQKSKQSRHEIDTEWEWKRTRNRRDPGNTSILTSISRYRHQADMKPTWNRHEAEMKPKRCDMILIWNILIWNRKETETQPKRNRREIDMERAWKREQICDKTELQRKWNWYKAETKPTRNWYGLGRTWNRHDSGKTPNVTSVRPTSSWHEIDTKPAWNWLKPTWNRREPDIESTWNRHQAGMKPTSNCNGIDVKLRWNWHETDKKPRWNRDDVIYIWWMTGMKSIYTEKKSSQNWHETKVKPSMNPSAWNQAQNDTKSTRNGNETYMNPTWSRHEKPAATDAIPTQNWPETAVVWLERDITPTTWNWCALNDVKVNEWNRHEVMWCEIDPEARRGKWHKAGMNSL